MSNFRFDSEEYVSFKIPFDKNTYGSWLLAVVILILLVLIAPLVELEPPRPIELQKNAVTIELLSFGYGDGTGGNKGNLAEEGKSFKGNESNNQLADAQIAAKSNQRTSSTLDPDQTSNIRPSANPGTNESSDRQTGGVDKRNIGKDDGDVFGSGLGDKGFGKGAGHGFGDIDWGGGGNRIVVYKKVPEYPPGVSASGTIRIQFTVLRDGTVDKMFPLEKADPRLERAAMDALRQWKFNPIQDNIVQVGIITLTFKLR